MYFIAAIVCFCAAAALFAYLKDKSDKKKRAKQPRNTPQTATPAQQITASNGGAAEKAWWRKKMEETAEKQWAKNALVVLAALVLIHIGAYLLLDDQYNKYFWNRGAFFTQVALGAGFAMRVRKKDAKPPQHWLGSIVLVMALLVVGKYVIWPLLPGIPAQASTTTRTPGQSVYVTTERGIIPPGTLKYPREGTFENKKVAERVLAGQWDLLAACFRESGGMKQFNSDGKVLIYENRDKETKKVTSIDRGACMINSQHDARIPNHPDADTLVGNLEFAKILYNEGKYPNQRGLKPWTPHLTKDEFVFEVPVDADGTETNTFIFPYEDITKYSFHPSVATTITVIDLDKVEHTLDIYPITERDPIAGGPVADKIRMYRFKAKDGKASVVTVTYRYK